jgi:hypothetical protein
LPRNTFSKLTCAAVLMSAAALCFASGAQAQMVTRVKARLTAFDANTLTLEPLPVQAPAKGLFSATPPPSPAMAGPLTVSVLPDTKYVLSQKSTFGNLKVGDYAGAAVVENRNGSLRAQDVYIYAETLRGTGEGRFGDSGRLMVNGVVSQVTPASEQDTTRGTFALHYRGATLTGSGKRAVCEGRAVPPQFASALACSGDAVIEVPSGTTVSALTMGDKSLLTPGATVSVSLVSRGDGSQVTPGVIIEPPITVEKPQSNP